MTDRDSLNRRETDAPDAILVNNVLEILIRRFGSKLLCQSHMEAIRQGVAICEYAYREASPPTPAGAVIKPQTLSVVKS